MYAVAPGKLILSGEHSVVYGAKALAMALDLTVRAEFTPNDTDQIRIHTGSPSLDRTLGLDDLAPLMQQLDQRFERFAQQQCRIADVFDDPSDLLFYTLARGDLKQGGVLHLHSDIPIGAGMGSSAACIAALLRVCEKANEQNPRKAQTLATLVRDCERLQHGKGSLIDAATVCLGGTISIQRDAITSMTLPLSPHWFIWHSGAPSASTGECVSHVRTHFAHSTIWQEFDRITSDLILAIRHNNPREITANIRQNQRLLTDIGVVPEAVNQTISTLSSHGIAAKVCGAGSISGHGAGQVLIYAPKHSQTQLEHQLNAPVLTLTSKARGAYAGS